ncbi:hypothetical protein SAMN05518669_103360 [Variovorax sp. YR634]|uniref:hypothetical protein n=1 Tax=Variovorax sp. YR634 TaxID=1884385 RepID=UPI0008992495|nr:hypothetical protein [Variovorax sp. YR634]SDX13109.1 hypothetical protein SAMN05518669_103360 [Variovorax sp. YR634]
MALTAQQIADVRRFAGYPGLGIDTPATDRSDMAFITALPSLLLQTLAHRLQNLTPENESTLINVYLTNLATLETDIVGSAANLDTESAAVWKHNKREVAERSALFDGWRRRMCGFLGVAPGPALGDGAMRIVRG